MAFLRQHPTADGGEWRPDRSIAGADVCMHAGFGPIRIDQTAGSLVVELENGQITAWATGTSLPCVSIFKPLWLDAMPEIGRPGEKFDPDVLWWRHERLQRAIHEDYTTRAPIYIDRIKGLEESFVTGAHAIKGASAQERRQFSQECLRLAAEAEDDVYEKISQLPIKSRNQFYYQLAWKGFNRDAGLLA
jgi:dipeptidase